MKKEFFFILSLAFLVLGCNKPDPAPHLKDPIFQDMVAQQAEAKAALEQAKKDHDEAVKDLPKAVPQTGQIKFAKKRIYDAEAKVLTLEQQVRYWEIRTKDRENFVKKQYLASFRKKEPWDNSKEVEQYMLEKRFRQKKMSWDAKDRIKEYQESNQPQSPAKPSGH